MSMASAATTSVVHDSNVGDEHEIVNHICILVATQGNGTLFPHNSIQEEDLVAVCIALRQTHMESVLWL